jgi:exopolyphosphatase / guanosine-5'-triphosphate,3'-diphosphate pyrophosphatase
VRVGVVDIGTNSMRLLIADRTGEVGRWVEVTGLGRGVDTTGVLSTEAIDETLSVFARFGRLMDSEQVAVRCAIATSASRDASNREEFFDQAEKLLGVRPTLVSGEVEARLAFEGATKGTSLTTPIVVSDIGGGSTEFVTADSGSSIDIGSVRLTERSLPNRPATEAELESARSLVDSMFQDVTYGAATLVGVAGTWTSLSAVAQDLPRYSREAVHGHHLSAEALDRLLVNLAGKTLDETAAIPSLDPKRAPVILAGAVVAQAVMRRLDAEEVIVSERDTLDGVAHRLLSLP